LKNSIVHKIINLLLISTFLLLINSCAYFRLKELDKHNFSQDNIYDLVSKEYKEFAYSELYEMHDELDANYFAFKANNILKTKIIRIENPKNWKIPDNYENEAKEEYKKISSLLKEEFTFQYPKLVAKLVSGYDCWLEQIEENWQIKDIEYCKNKFTNAYKKILASEVSKQSISKKQKSEISSSSVSEKNKSYFIKGDKTKSVLVFFNYDSHKLSITEKDKLDNYISTLIKTDSNPIIIYGHTDTKGSKKYNLILSEQRALSVSKYFRKKGINNKLIIKSYGEDYPLIITGDNVEEENNRRVEVIINN
jgi:OOP family OmpA-OmpF porin